MEKNIDIEELYNRVFYLEFVLDLITKNKASEYIRYSRDGRIASKEGLTHATQETIRLNRNKVIEELQNMFLQKEK